MHQTFIDLFLALRQYLFIYANIVALIACIVACRVALFVSSFVSLSVDVRIAYHNDCKAETKQHCNTSHKQCLFVD
jgi:hypothetical protein